MRARPVAAGGLRRATGAASGAQHGRANDRTCGRRTARRASRRRVSVGGRHRYGLRCLGLTGTARTRRPVRSRGHSVHGRRLRLGGGASVSGVGAAPRGGALGVVASRTGRTNALVARAGVRRAGARVAFAGRRASAGGSYGILCRDRACPRSGSNGGRKRRCRSYALRPSLLGAVTSPGRVGRAGERATGRAVVQRRALLLSNLH